MEGMNRLHYHGLGSWLVARFAFTSPCEPFPQYPRRMETYVKNCLIESTQE